VGLISPQTHKISTRDIFSCVWRDSSKNQRSIQARNQTEHWWNQRTLYMN